MNFYLTTIGSRVIPLNAWVQSLANLLFIYMATQILYSRFPGIFLWLLQRFCILTAALPRIWNFAIYADSCQIWTLILPSNWSTWNSPKYLPWLWISPSPETPDATFRPCFEKSDCFQPEISISFSHWLLISDPYELPQSILLIFFRSLKLDSEPFLIPKNTRTWFLIFLNLSEAIHYRNLSSDLPDRNVCIDLLQQLILIHQILNKNASDRISTWSLIFTGSVFPINPDSFSDLTDFDTLIHCSLFQYLSILWLRSIFTATWYASENSVSAKGFGLP